MSLNFRIFLAYFLIIGVAAYLFLNVFISEIRPGIRQSTEDTLVDMANLLAELIADEFSSDQIQHQNLNRSMQRFLNRSYRANIFSIEKLSSRIRIYITDQKGIVRYDSSHTDVGKDYSRWNDVYLTLRGQYGVRSTKSIPGNELSSIMYVAAPIKNGDQIIGVLTVAKPNLTVQPFIELAQSKIEIRGLILVALSLVFAIGISYWLTASIRRLAHYSDKIAHGEQATLPKIAETELSRLAASIDNMRRQLEGKDTIEKYVHSLTHELKSPVSTIKGAAELINVKMPDNDLEHFKFNILQEVDRIDEMINRLLALASLEKREQLEQIESVDLAKLVGNVIQQKQLQLDRKHLSLTTQLPVSAMTTGDPFLLNQALDNLLQNAIDFSLERGEITIKISLTDSLCIVIKDSGGGIPEYARKKIFDRFYSLPRPDSGHKSSGLGLCFVQQIAKLHRGSITLENQSNGGVVAILKLPV